MSSADNRADSNVGQCDFVCEKIIYESFPLSVKNVFDIEFGEMKDFPGIFNNLLNRDSCLY